LSRKKHVRVTLRSNDSLIPAREFEFTLTEYGVVYKEFGRRESENSFSWQKLIGHCLIFAKKVSKEEKGIPGEDWRSVDIELRCMDAAFSAKQFTVWFSDRGIFIDGIGWCASGQGPYITWR
jgi:hypothetical protein